MASVKSKVRLSFSGARSCPESPYLSHPPLARQTYSASLLLAWFSFHPSFLNFRRLGRQGLGSGLQWDRRLRCA